MSLINWADPLWELAARFAINTIAMVLLMFGMYRINSAIRRRTHGHDTNGPSSMKLTRLHPN